MEVGDKIKVEYPFRFVEISPHPFGSSVNDAFWLLGCHKHFEDDGSGYTQDCYLTANGIGFVEYEILAIVDMPRRMQQRIIYKFDKIDPEGGIVKSSKTYTESITVFNGRLKGYKYEYELEE